MAKIGNAFKRRQLTVEITLSAVRWFLQLPLLLFHSVVERPARFASAACVKPTNALPARIC
jgi:hypothetical protein